MTVNPQLREESEAGGLDVATCESPGGGNVALLVAKGKIPVFQEDFVSVLSAIQAKS